MLTKGFRQLLDEANAVIETISAADAKELHEQGEVIFVDVREGQERANGFVAGSIHASRGFLEFIIDPEGPMHNAAFASGKRLVLYCGSGGRSALAAKTLHDLGLTNVCHVAGGFAAWNEAGGPVDR